MLQKHNIHFVSFHLFIPLVKHTGGHTLSHTLVSLPLLPGRGNICESVVEDTHRFQTSSNQVKEAKSVCSTSETVGAILNGTRSIEVGVVCADGFQTSSFFLYFCTDHREDAPEAIPPQTPPASKILKGDKKFKKQASPSPAVRRQETAVDAETGREDRESDQSPDPTGSSPHEQQLRQEGGLKRSHTLTH